jgi:hypothetical protein
MGNQLAATKEFQKLAGYPDTFVWDLQADEIPTSVASLSRLALYNPASGKFDQAVTQNSIQSTPEKPLNVYFLVHGWAPGSTQAVLLGSTPGDPGKWWQTDDSPWLYNGVSPISMEGLAQSIIDQATATHTNAEVIAFSWIDQSATPAGSQITVTGNLTAGSAIVKRVRTKGLAVGMAVSGPGIPTVNKLGIPTDVYIKSINGPRQLTLSVPALSTVASAISVNVSSYTLGAKVSLGSATVQNVDTTRLIPGMQVVVPGVKVKPSDPTISIKSIDGTNQLTLTQPINQDASLLEFIGANLSFDQQKGNIDKNATSIINGLDTSKLTAGMTVEGGSMIPAGDAIFSILSPTSVSLTKAASSAGPGLFTFKGVNLAATTKQSLYGGESEAATQQNGLVLADAIRSALAPNFFTTSTGGTGGGLIHILGHSHGAKVATVAALALQQSPVPVPVAQLTTLESPEGGPVDASQNLHFPGILGAENFLWYYLQQMKISTTPVGSGRTSTGSTFVDNYYSYQGFGSALGGYDLSNFPINGSMNDLSSIVDVELHPELLYGALALSDPPAAIATLAGSHAYPPPWYGQTGLLSQSNPPIGLNWSPLINPSNVPSSNSYEQPTQITRSGANVKTTTRVITGVDTTGLVAGMAVTDSLTGLNPYIPKGSTIESIDPTNHSITIQPQNPTGDDPDDTLYFTYTSPSQYVSNQYFLQTNTRPSPMPAEPQPLQYAQQYSVGTVNDTGSEITLSVGAGSSSAIDAITFNPLAAGGVFDLGAGMDFRLKFDGVTSGQPLELVVWIKGIAAAPVVASGLVNIGSTLGSMSIPLFTMDAADAGTSATYATISLDGFFNSILLRAPFNTVNGGSAATIVPSLGFTLIGGPNSKGSVTVSSMRQFVLGP